MPCLLNVESFLISSDLIASQLLLEIVHCIPLSPQSASSHLVSTHLMSSPLFSPNLIPSLSHSRLFSADHNCSLLFSCHLSFSHLFSSPRSLSQLSSKFHSSSQLFSTLLTSPQLMLGHLLSFHLPLLFSHLLSSSDIP